MNKAYTKVAEIWEEQLKDIGNARSSILLEQYIIEDIKKDDIGHRFITALIKKAKEGVKVHCILDAQGSFELFWNSELNAELKAAGGRYFYYKTLGRSKLVNPARLFLRDHRKLLMIDHSITWIGGAVIGERYRNWSDLMVRFEDKNIADIANKEFRNQFLRLQDKFSLLAPMEPVNEETHLSGNAPGIGNRFCYEEICHAIMLAQTSVVMVTPYFAPPYKLMRVLKRRLRGGLDITLIVPRVSNSWIADAAREFYLQKLLKMGLKVKYFEGMLHAKIVATDNNWVSFGSTNLDGLSLIFNHELNLASRDSEITGMIHEVISEFGRGLEIVTMNSCEYKNLSLFKRLAGRTFKNIV